MAVQFNAGSGELFGNLGGLSLSTSTLTATWLAKDQGDGTVVELRTGAATVASIGMASGALGVYNTSTNPSAGSPPTGWWEGYMTFSGGVITVGFRAQGSTGGFTGTTNSLINTGTIVRCTVGGDFFDPEDINLSNFKLFNSVLSAGAIDTELRQFKPVTPAYVWLPMNGASVAACALDQSGNGLDFSVNGSPALIADPPIANGLVAAFASSVRPFMHNLAR